MNYSYQTIQKAIIDVVLKEKGSKFISYAFPVLNENDVTKELEKLKSLHPKATHICYAYRLGSNGKTYRINDDGEPSGSAGLPIYNQILSHDITFVFVAVVRYYGGTKLGVGGLIKAYKESAKEALDTAEIINQELYEQITLKVPYDRQSKVYQIINKYNLNIIDVQHLTLLEITISIPLKNYESMVELFENITDIEIVFPHDN